MSEATMAQAVLAACHEKGIVLCVAGEKLTMDAPKGVITPDFLAELRQHKASLIEILQKGGSGPVAQQSRSDLDHSTAPGVPNDADIMPWEECIEPPSPCPKCGCLMVWWDVLGGQHCMICEKPKHAVEKAAELRELAKRLRQFPKRASSLRKGS
jgi:hypothetical protein